MNATAGAVRLSAQDILDLAHGEGRVDEVLALTGGDLGLAALQQPEVHLRIEIATPTGLFAHLAWISRDAVLLLLDLGEDYKCVVLPPDHLATGIARIVGLQPRRVGHRSAGTVDVGVVEGWFAPTAAERTAAWAAVGADRAWALVALRPDAEAPGGRLLAVADGPGGTWIVEGDEGALRQVPVRPTDVYRRLAGLLPGLG